MARPPVNVRLADPDADRVRRNHDERIAELAGLPAAGLRVIRNVSLADGVDTPVSHGLGRVPSWVAPSAVRGAIANGRIEEVRTNGSDRTMITVLRAVGYGTTITVDVAVL